jgi:PAS domain S-box-containing protein
VAQAKALTPDLILMDVAMPLMDGIEATRIIHKELPDIDVIIVSQNEPRLVALQAADSGARCYIAKPDLSRTLISTIDEIAASRHVEPTAQSADGRGKRLHVAAGNFGARTSDLLAAIVGSSDDAIISKNLDGVITSWNESAERIFGYMASEAVGQHITLIIPEDRLEEEKDILDRLRRGERVDHFETVRVRRDGTKLDISLTISPVKDASGRVVGASKVARDITNQKRAEQALRTSEERFRTIFDTTPECVKVVSRDGTVLHMNRAGLQILGAHSISEVVGENVYAMIAPEDRERYRAFNERVCSGEKASLEFDIIRPDGQRRHMGSHAAPLRNPDGCTVQLGVSQDITERKAALERERKITAEAVAAEAKFRAVFEQTTVFAGIMDNAGILVEANKLSLQACGYSSEEVLGKPFWETPWWRNFPEAREKIRAAAHRAAKGAPYREILRYSWADGSEHIVDFALYPIVDENREVLFLHPTGVDITGQKETEEKYRELAETLDAEVRARTGELERRNAEILRQSELLREFALRSLHTQEEERRHIARELHDSAGQTLAVLGINLAQLARAAVHTAPELSANVEAIEQTVRQLSNEIRTTSYLLHPPLLDENGISSALGWYVQGLKERSGLDIHLHIADGFERLARDLELAIFRLVQECLTNIHRHSESKTASIHIARDGDRITVDVKDQGKGISADKLIEIQSGGSGVGIRGMRERLRQFGGQLNIVPQATGTHVSVIIPIQKCDSSLTQEQLPVTTLRATG